MTTSTAQILRGARTASRAPRGGSLRTLGLPVAGVLSVLVVMEAVSRLGLVNPDYFPPVTRVFGKSLELLGDGEVWSSIMLTLEGWALGLLIACAIGIPVGLASGLLRVVYHSLRPIVEFLRPVPSLALLPLAVVIMGTGMESKVFLASFASTWPILVHSMYGIRDLDPLQLDVARSYQFGRVGTIIGVLVPSSIAHIATGIRVASSIALALVISTEIIIGAPGLGQVLNVARASGNVLEVFALILIAGLLGVLLNIVVRSLERRTLSWHVSHRKDSA